MVTILPSGVLGRMNLVVPHDDVPFLDCRSMLNAFLKSRRVYGMCAGMGRVMSESWGRHVVGVVRRLDACKRGMYKQLRLISTGSCKTGTTDERNVQG